MKTTLDTIIITWDNFILKFTYYKIQTFFGVVYNKKDNDGNKNNDNDKNANDNLS